MPSIPPGIVIGVDRHDDPRSLLRGGAHAVVDDPLSLPSTPAGDPA